MVTMDRALRYESGKHWSSAATGSLGTRTPPLVDERFVSLTERRLVMEPVHEEKTRKLERSAERKPKRFRIVKLEERIAPGAGGHGSNHTCGSGYQHGCPTVVGQCR
jgi:hypothetical protein